ncbi:hypothetical protein C8J57DRAFT_1093865, partial [Mycena rebaudengoi]
VSNIFTASVRTSGENRVNKSIGGPKKSFLQLFNGLNSRSEEQGANNLIRSLFSGPLQIIRAHAGPFAVQKCYSQMEDTLFYTTEVVQRPTEVTSWVMFNSFQNDKAYISVRWLIELVIKRGLVIRHLLIVRHKSTGTFHYIAILSDGHYICDCCMPANISIPCGHYFRIWIDVQKLPFHISFIRSRPVPLQLTTSNIQLIFRFYNWYQDPELLVHSPCCLLYSRASGRGIPIANTICWFGIRFKPD